MKRAVCAVLLCTLALNACFSYRAVPPAEVPPQATEVRVQLSRPMDFPISDITVRDVVQVTGEVVGADSSWLRLSAYGLRAQTGYSVPVSGETVQVPRGQVVGLQRKKMDAARSVGLGAALVAGTLVVAAISGGLDFGRGGSPRPPPPQ